jgi:hypothetical protein
VIEAAQLDLIVTGATGFVAINSFRDIPIVTPAAFAHGVAR